MCHAENATVKCMHLNSRMYLNFCVLRYLVIAISATPKNRNATNEQQPQHLAQMNSKSTERQKSEIK